MHYDAYHSGTQDLAAVVLQTAHQETRMNVPLATEALTPAPVDYRTCARTRLASR